MSDGVFMGRLSVAPMMDWTDRHYRFLARMISKRTALWTEMVVGEDLRKKDEIGREILLGHSEEEHPLVLQLGGAEPEVLAEATDIAVSHRGRHFEEFNLNCGCPSSRVTSCERQFGARLMHEPDTVSACVRAISRASGSTPVSVKCRLGTDEKHGYQQLKHFVSTVSVGGGVRHFVIHSRECVLDGLTPRQNRSVPPLRPRWAHELKKDFPELIFSINGGITSLDMAQRHLSSASGAEGSGPAVYGSYEGISGLRRQDNCLDEEYVWPDLPAVQGVMIGREAYGRPWLLCNADTRIYGAAQDPNTSRREILETYLDYGERMVSMYNGFYQKGNPAAAGYSTRNLMNPLLGLFALERCGREWRRCLDKEYIGKGIVGKKDPEFREMVEAAMQCLPDEVLDPRANGDIER